MQTAQEKLEVQSFDKNFYPNFIPHQRKGGIHAIYR
jgi:hypothetical protein